MPDPAPRHDLSRREWLRVGGIGLGGLTLPDLLAAPTNAATGSPGRAKSVIMICLLGGPGQHESWDPKPHAPEEVRGEFGTIPSAVPGINVGELMPLTAAHTDKTAVLRAVATDDNAHSSSGYQMLTGVPHIPMNRENSTPKFPNRTRTSVASSGTCSQPSMASPLPSSCPCTSSTTA